MACLVVARNVTSVLHPSMTRDCARLFNYFAEPRGVEALLRPDAGYVPLVPNLVGQASSWLPLHDRPYVFTAVSVLIATLCLGLFASRRFSHIVRSTRVRGWTCAMLALSPLGNAPLDTDLAFSHWHVLLAAVLLAFARPARSRRGALADAVVMTACVFSNPLSIVLVPVCAWRAWTAPSASARWAYGVPAGMAVVYQIACVQHGRADAPACGAFLKTLADLHLGRAMAEVLLGAKARASLAGGGMSCLPAIAGGAVVLTLAVAWRGLRPRRRRALLWWAGVSVALTGAAVYGRFEHILQHPLSAQRYFYVQRVLLCLAIAVVLESWLGARNRGAWALVALAAIVHSRLVSHYNDGAYWTSSQGSEYVQRFLQRAEVWRWQPGSPDDVLRMRGLPIVVPRRAAAAAGDSPARPAGR